MWKLWLVSNVHGKIHFQQINDHSSNDPHSVSCYIGASDPSNLQPAASNINNNQFLAAVPCESRESETKAKLVIIVTSCPESTPIAFAYATTVEVVVVEEKIPHILIDFWITTKGGERKLFKWILSNHQSKAILLS